MPGCLHHVIGMKCTFSLEPGRSLLRVLFSEFDDQRIEIRGPTADDCLVRHVAGRDTAQMLLSERHRLFEPEGQRFHFSFTVLTHQLSPAADQGQRRAEIQCPCREQSAVLSQTVSGTNLRDDAPSGLFLVRLKTGDGMCQKRGLCVASQVDLLIWVQERQFSHVIP